MSFLSKLLGPDDPVREARRREMFALWSRASERERLALEMERQAAEFREQADVIERALESERSHQ